MKALVTGGGGFLGGAIVRMLLERGDEIISYSRSRYEALERLGVRQVCGDVADEAALTAAAQGCDVIFHVAAKAGIWGDYDDYFRANVTGTAAVIAACRANGIKRLVATGSPSVVFDGTDVEGGDESLPYPDHYETHYPKTKMLAEKLVLAANSPELATVSLRPHLIWGPGDNHLVPRIIAKAKTGRLKRIGNRPCLVDTIYVDNAAKAHLQAADRLYPGSQIAGKAYFITNDEPIPLWEMVDRILAAAGLPPVKGEISSGAARFIGAFCEKVWGMFKLKGEPPMTRFVANELSTTHWFDISAAKRDLGYQVDVSMEEGLKRLHQWLAASELLP
ncbi:MAG: NAD-dependent epimerase/dehydratase family protein [Geobacteraceae bacterium]|nr:NAD-dependent epimerase/dehydratase family protein [Geobacteraceae bacterium]